MVKKNGMKESEEMFLTELENRGLKPVIFHRRYEKEPASLGRIQVIADTTVYIVPADYVVEDYEAVRTDAISVGQAWCSSKDQFSRRKGRLVAIARAVKTLKEAGLWQ